ncbi:MAG: hypothetical protein HY084_10890 [Gemmatimonadetes bacterium]|nr:hypothetical protein [Gemmatimonadota bacterium]
MSHAHPHPPHLPHAGEDHGAPARVPGRLSAEMLAAFAAILLSVCGLAVSIYEANLERHFHRAQVWPRLEIASGRANGLQLIVSNAGIGPAVIERVDVRVDDKPVTDWGDALTRLVGRPPQGAVSSSLGERVLRPGEQVVMLDVPAGDSLLPRVISSTDRLGMAICYRSVFDERWELIVPPGTAAPRVDAVSRCPAADTRGRRF